MLTDDDTQARRRPQRGVRRSAAGGGADHADQIIVLDPSRITNLAVHEIDLALDALQRGERHIILDDGDPRLICTRGR